MIFTKNFQSKIDQFYLENILRTFHALPHFKFSQPYSKWNSNFNQINSKNCRWWYRKTTLENLRRAKLFAKMPLELFTKMDLNFLSLFIFKFLENAINALQFVIFLVVILSWFSVRKNRVVLFLNGIAAPILSAARKVVPRIGVLDFSPIVAFFACDLLRFGLFQIQSALF